MRKIKSIILLIFSFSLLTPCLAQKQGQDLIDSLKSTLYTTKEDTVKIIVLRKLSYLNWHINPDTGLMYGQQALKLALNLNWKRGVALSLGAIGVNLIGKADFTAALDNLLKAAKIDEALGYSTSLSFDYNEIGEVYHEAENYPKSLEFYTKALKVNENLSNKIGIARNLRNMGNEYKFLHNYKMALENMFKAVQISEETGDKTGLGRGYQDLGLAYKVQSDYTKALVYSFKSLKITTEMNDSYPKGTNLSVIGEIYLDAATSINPKLLDSLFNGNKKMALQQSVKYSGDAILVLEKLGHLALLRDTYKNYSEAKKLLDDYKGALADYQTYSLLKDSLINNINSKKLTQLTMQYDFDKKQDSLKTLEMKTELIHEGNEKRQRIVIYSVAGGLLLVIIFAVFIFRSLKIVNKEKKLADSLLLNILPAEVASELKAYGSAKAKNYDDVTVMFTDFKGFTTIGEQLTPIQLVAEINHCFVAYDNIIYKYGIEKIKTIGDAYMAVCGLPLPDASHAEKVVKACKEIVQFMEDYKRDRIKNNQPYFESRIGINSGSVVAGIVGVKKFAYDIWGDSVNTAARMEQNSEPGKINISDATYKLVKDKFTCTYRGKIHAKNKGEIDMYFVES